LILAVIFGCDDRGTNIQPTDLGELANYNGIDPDEIHVFQPAMTLQLRNPNEELFSVAYLPPEAATVEFHHPVPLLILLAPEEGTRYYYFKAGLSQLMRELTASGEIQPMVVFCIGNDQTFGGYFYANSGPGGYYDSIFYHDPADDYRHEPGEDGTGMWETQEDLLEYLHGRFPATIELASKRGIGGIGQGAYGAFRAVIKNPELYNSISVADGPLDFDGPGGASGLMSLFSSALAEQQSHYYSDPVVDTIEVTAADPYEAIFVDTIILSIVDTVFDSTYVDFDTMPFNFRNHFDSSHTMPISQMMIGGSLAFSPNDTLITFERITPNNMVRVPLETVFMSSIADSMQVGGGDSTTFIGDLIKPSETTTRWLDLDFHLPFDSTGHVYQPIWDLWMRNNLEEMYLAEGGDPLGNVNIWIGTNPHAKWHYFEMTQSWISFLRNQNVLLEEYIYSGYDEDIRVIGDEYLFDILREMLIFHSERFGE
jgi:hypothetical protein